MQRLQIEENAHINMRMVVINDYDILSFGGCLLFDSLFYQSPFFCFSTAKPILKLNPPPHLFALGPGY